jgi:hypothetical protein
MPTSDECKRRAVDAALCVPSVYPDCRRRETASQRLVLVTTSTYNPATGGVER